jgi:hypothetical protein
MATQNAFWQHPANSQFQCFVRLFDHEAAVRYFLQAANVTSVVAMLLLKGFIAAELDAFCTGNDDIVAAIDAWRVSYFVLAHQDSGDADGQTAKDLVGGINMVPVILSIGGCGEGSFHGVLLYR